MTMTMASEESEAEPSPPSLSEVLSLSVALLDGGEAAAPETAPPAERAIALLTELQGRVSRAGLFSRNEALDDVPTPSLELLDADFQLGRAHLMLPTYPPPPREGGGRGGGVDGPSPSLARKRNVNRALEYFHSFLGRLERLGEGCLPEAALKEYHATLDSEDAGPGPSPSRTREAKIQRFQRKRSVSQNRSRLQSQLERRSRLGVGEEEMLDGHDLESLRRTIFVETLRMHADECLEEIQSSRVELEMLDMAIKMESSGIRGGTDPRMARNGDVRGRGGAAPQAPLQMTQITRDLATGQLRYTEKRAAGGRLCPMGPPRAAPPQAIRRQEIADGVFRPGWNLPTMSLAELAERERAEAMQRSEAQALAEAEAKSRPRRYNQLVKDGMEDNERLVEASSKLDREWDNWKDDNPKGSGNKMGERGDRNF